MVAAGKVDDEVGGRVEDEGEVVEAGQAEDPWVDMAWADLFSGAEILLQLVYCYGWDIVTLQLGYCCSWDIVIDWILLFIYS